MIVRSEAVPLEAQPARSLVLKRLITGEAHSANLSLTWVSIDGHHDRIVNQESDRVYYVIEGQGRFQAGDDAPVEDVSAGDCVFIAKGTPYEFEGSMRYVVVNSPAFRAGADTVLPSTFPP
jgi:mannose-6-phosphate isomerase-like protein (cupin superfamily)